MTLIDSLRAHLVTHALVRAPDVAGGGARPWLPPCWRHPDDGPPGPGDASAADRPATNGDDGLVISLMHAPSIVGPAGAEERRIDGVDVVMRGVRVQTIDQFEQDLRALLVGTNPGGMTDFTMAGLYIIQCQQWAPYQALAATGGVFTFKVGYVFEHRAA